MNALILTTLLSAQNCPGGVCPVPARVVVVTQTPPPPVAPVKFSLSYEGPGLRNRAAGFASRGGPIRNAFRRLFR